MKYEEFFPKEERTLLGRIKEKNHAAYAKRMIPSRRDISPEEREVLRKERAYYALKNKEAWAGMDLKEEIS